MGDAGGQFLFVVGDHDERLVGALAESFDDVLHQLTVFVVEAVQGLVEDEQLWVFDEGTGNEHEALLAAGQLQKRAVGQLFDAEDAHPRAALFQLVGCGTDVKPYGVLESAGDDADGGDVTMIGTGELWRHIADVTLDVPDADAALAPLVSEELYVAGIALWVVGTNERQQR